MSTALRSAGLLVVLSGTPAEPLVARLIFMPVCAASLRNLVRNAGQHLLFRLLIDPSQADQQKYFHGRQPHFSDEFRS